MLEELSGRLSDSGCNELSDGELGRPVDANEQVKLAFGGLYFGNVDVEDADGIAFKLLAPWLIALNIRQALDPVPLQAPVQRRPCQVRYRGLQGIETVVQR